MLRHRSPLEPTTAAMLCPTLFVLAVACATAQAETTIVVNWGPHASAQAAARAEEKVDWLDADTADDTVCTECFAAVELQQCLRRMIGRAEGFAVVNDNQLPEGDLVLIGGPGSNAASRRWGGRLGIDSTQLADLGPQGYRIRSAALEGRRMTLLAGGSRIGTLYATYDLLHRLGCQRRPRRLPRTPTHQMP